MPGGGFDIFPGGFDGEWPGGGGAQGGALGTPGFGTAASEMGGPALGATQFTLNSPAVGALSSLMGGNIAGAAAKGANAALGGVSPSVLGVNPGTTIASKALSALGVPSGVGMSTLPGDIAMGLGKLSTNKAVSNFGANTMAGATPSDVSDIALGIPGIAPHTTTAQLQNIAATQGPMAALEAAQAMMAADPAVQANQGLTPGGKVAQSTYGGSTVGLPSGSTQGTTALGDTSVAGAGPMANVPGSNFDLGNALGYTPSEAAINALVARSGKETDPTLAAAEHNAFAQDMVSNFGPLGAVGMLVAPPAYGALKALGQATGLGFKDASPASMSQVYAGQKPAADYFATKLGFNPPGSSQGSTQAGTGFGQGSAAPSSEGGVSVGAPSVGYGNAPGVTGTEGVVGTVGPGVVSALSSTPGQSPSTAAGVSESLGNMGFGLTQSAPTVGQGYSFGVGGLQGAEAPSGLNLTLTPSNFMSFEAAPDSPTFGPGGTIGPGSSISFNQSEAGTSLSGAQGTGIAGVTGPAAAGFGPNYGGFGVSAPGGLAYSGQTGAEGEAGAPGTPAGDVGAQGVGAPGEAGVGGGPGGAGDGGKIICNELHRQGLMDDKTWAADEAFGRLVPAHVIRGYHLWARPLVKAMQRSPLVTRIVHKLAQPWINEMAYLMGARPNSTRLGRFCMKAGMEICGRIGAMRYKHGLV